MQEFDDKKNAQEATSGVIGIIGAMASEVDAIKAAMEDKSSTTIAGMEFVSGTIAGRQAIVVQCGEGKVAAAICAQTLIAVCGATRVINTGVAGSLTDELSVMDFVVSVDAVQHDYDVSPLGYPKGEIPCTGLAAFPADEHLRNLAVDAVKQVCPQSKLLVGRVCSGDQFISTREQVERITSEFGGYCCEMEGASIAQVCHMNGTPFVVVRAISDGSDETDFQQFQAQAARACAEVVMEMVAHL
jgi:adenosylhomocysteine nucleosidase